MRGSRGGPDPHRASRYRTQIRRHDLTSRPLIRRVLHTSRRRRRRHLDRDHGGGPRLPRPLACGGGPRRLAWAFSTGVPSGVKPSSAWGGKPLGLAIRAASAMLAGTVANANAPATPIMLCKNALRSMKDSRLGADPYQAGVIGLRSRDKMSHRIDRLKPSDRDPPFDTSQRNSRQAKDRVVPGHRFRMSIARSPKAGPHEASPIVNRRGVPTPIGVADWFVGRHTFGRRFTRRARAAVLMPRQSGASPCRSGALRSSISAETASGSATGAQPHSAASLPGR